jgi:hypothetical protein
MNVCPTYMGMHRLFLSSDFRSHSYAIKYPLTPEGWVFRLTEESKEREIP